MWIPLSIAALLIAGAIFFTQVKGFNIKMPGISIGAALG